jgi:hypothetical protein
MSELRDARPVPSADAASPAPDAGLRDCLGEHELLALGTAPPGALPDAVARHLAVCETCQQRVLLASTPHLANRRPRQPASLQRSLVLVGAVLLALALFLYSVYKLAGLS